MTNLILEGQNNNLSFKMKILIAKNKFIGKKKAILYRYMNTKSLFTAFNRIKGDVCSFPNHHQLLPLLLRCHITPIPTYTAAVKQPRTTLFPTSRAQYFT